MVNGKSNIEPGGMEQSSKREFAQLISDGRRWGIRLSYAVQAAPEGIPQAFIIGESFIGADPCALILGDNIFYGHDLSSAVQAVAPRSGAARRSSPIRCRTRSATA
jgi:dTDP-glucose pyrophosphorylase